MGVTGDDLGHIWQGIIYGKISFESISVGPI